MKAERAWVIILLAVLIGPIHTPGQSSKQQTPRPAEKKDSSPTAEVKKKPKLPAEVEAIIDDARSVPAEFAADALIRLAESNQVADHEWKRDLLEEAFRSAASAQHPMRRHDLPG